MSAAWSNNTITKPVPCLPSKTRTSQYARKYRNYKTTILKRLTLSIVLPTSSLMMYLFIMVSSYDYYTTLHFGKENFEMETLESKI